MIAVTFALPAESRDFRKLLDEHQHEIAILHTGVGEKICRERIGPFLDAQQFDFLISSGFAGGVDPSLGAGDLLLAENFSDPALLARARDILIARVACLATADRIVANAADRAAFARERNAVAVDMETEWIAQACAARKLPLLSLRAISDTALAPFPAPPAVLFDLARQQTNPLSLARYLLMHPNAISRLLRFVRQIATARAELATALTTVLRTLV